MQKIQKIECITIVLLIIIFFLLMIEALQNMTFFSEPSVSGIEILLLVVMICFAVTFLIVYIIKIVTVKSKRLKLVWSIFPIAAIFFSVVFVNGVCGADEEFFYLNILGVCLGILMVILYNIFLFFYYGDDKRPIVTMVLYNAIVVYSSVCDHDLSYVHHYYLGYLLFAIVIGYIEIIIQGLVTEKTEYRK